MTTSPRPGGRLLVLTYHAFAARPSVTATDPSRFAATLDALIGAGGYGVDLDDWVARGRPDEPKGFALTFDDGLRSVLKVADAVRAHRLPATVYLVAGRVGGDNAWPGQRAGVAVEPLLDWSEVAALASLGFRFGSHGMTHARLDRLGAERLGRELAESRDIIEGRLGRPCRSLAYPDGSESAAVRRAASGYYAAALGTRLDYVGGRQGATDLARVDAYYLRSDRVLDALATGRAGGWLRWRRSIRAVRRGFAAASARGGPDRCP